MAVPAGAALLLLLVPLAGVPARALRLRRARDRPDRVARLDIALWLAAAVGVAAVLGTAAAVVDGARQSVIVPALGVPSRWAWVLLLPWLLAPLWGYALVLAARTPRAASRAHTLARWSGLTLLPSRRTHLVVSVRTSVHDKTTSTFLFGGAAGIGIPAPCVDGTCVGIAV